MKIESIEIQNLVASGLDGPHEGVFHQKTLACLSVCQALHGSYDVEIGGSGKLCTGEGGVFAAPGGALQKLTHHDGAGGRMRAHWVFMDVTVNGRVRLESLYRIPAVLPHEYDAFFAGRLALLCTSDDVCARYAAAYEIVGVLLRVSEPLAEPDPLMSQFQKVVFERCAEPLSAADLAAALHCSVPQVYRCSKKFFRETPANYINSIRLQNAARLLESSDRQIKEIAYSAGFSDPAYFSRLFKKAFWLPPQEYRRRHTAP